MDNQNLKRGKLLENKIVFDPKIFHFKQKIKLY